MRASPAGSSTEVPLNTAHEVAFPGCCKPRLSYVTLMASIIQRDPVKWVSLTDDVLKTLDLDLRCFLGWQLDGVSLGAEDPSGGKTALTGES